MKNEIKSTAHSKYRRKVIYRTLRQDIGQIYRKICIELKVEIIEAEA